MSSKPTHRFQKKKNSDTSALLMGWIFITVLLFAITAMILYSKPAPRLECDYRRGATLNQFGTCKAVK